MCAAQYLPSRHVSTHVLLLYLLIYTQIKCTLPTSHAYTQLLSILPGNVCPIVDQCSSPRARNEQISLPPGVHPAALFPPPPPRKQMRGRAFGRIRATGADRTPLFFLSPFFSFSFSSARWNKSTSLRWLRPPRKIAASRCGN